MKALDLFCCAGGASAGLAQAGFEVTGVDIADRPSYPYTFIRGDALDMPIAFIRQFDLVWASPPCQRWTAYRRKSPETIGADAPDLIAETRALLTEAGVPYVIENVEGARPELRDPITLCGSSFGLDVRRHRLFEASFPVDGPPCDHKIHVRRGRRFPQATNRKNRRYTAEIGVWRIPLDQQHAAMGGCEWMSLEELSQAIPPAYSKYLAERFLGFQTHRSNSCQSNHNPCATADLSRIWVTDTNGVCRMVATRGGK